MCQRDGGCFGRRSRPKGRASRRPLPPPSAEPARWAILLCALPHRHPRRAQPQQSLSATKQPHGRSFVARGAKGSSRFSAKGLSAGVRKVLGVSTFAGHFSPCRGTPRATPVPPCGWLLLHQVSQPRARLGFGRSHPRTVGAGHYSPCSCRDQVSPVSVSASLSFPRKLVV
jgi:hypothetical protein